MLLIIGTPTLIMTLFLEKETGGFVLPMSIGAQKDNRKVQSISDSWNFSSSFDTILKRVGVLAKLHASN